MRPALVGFALTLLTLFLFGLEGDAPAWITWLAGACALASIVVTVLPLPSLRLGACFGLAAVLVVAFVAGRATHAPAWLTYWLLAHALSYGLLGVAFTAPRTPFRRPVGLAA